MKRKKMGKSENVYIVKLRSLSTPNNYAFKETEFTAMT